MSVTSSPPEKPSPQEDVRIAGRLGPEDWHKSAPASVRKAFSSGNIAAGWAAWRSHLGSRRRPVDPVRLLNGGREVLSWGLPEGLDAAPTPDWLADALRQSQDKRRQVDPSLEREVLCRLGEAAGGTADVGCVLEALACCRALPRLATVLSPEAWFALLDHLLAAVADAVALVPDDDPLLHQLAAGELPLTLAYLFPEITPCRKLKSAARAALSAGLIDLLDGEGLPHGIHLPLLRPLLSCWTRCRELGEKLKGSCWTAPAEDQYEWLVRHALRLTRHNGTHVFSNGLPGSADGDLLRAALHYGGDDDDHEIAAVVLPGRKRSGKKAAGTSTLPEAATHSQWASVAVLRADWSRTGPRLAVRYPGRSVQLELGVGKDLLLSGEWGLHVGVDGKPLTADCDWEEVCWVSDEDVDYLELEIELTGGFRVQRQMLLAREDRFLLLADALLGNRTGKIQYRGTLPLGRNVELRGARQSREGYLIGSKRRAFVLPLALPEWRAETGIGELTAAGGALELHQSIEGCRLYAPLFFDLDGRRMTRRLTWRRLTVVESLQAVPPEVAAGYRVAIGKRQWLIYRSLAEKANRTLLGHNLSTEMLVAQFERTGEVEPLIEIE